MFIHGSRHELKKALFRIKQGYSRVLNSNNKRHMCKGLYSIVCVCVRQQEALLLSFNASKLHSSDKKVNIFTYLTIKAVIALIVTVLH